MHECQIKRGREIPKKIIREYFKKDLEYNELDPNMHYNRTLYNLIY